MKNKYLLIGLIIVAIGIVVGSTYAFYMAVINGDGSSITIKSGKLSLELEDNNPITLNNAQPGDSASKEFTVTNTSKSTLLYNIKLVDVINTFVDKNDLVYTLVGDNNTNIEEIIVPSESDEYIATDISIDSGITHTYTLTITFKETNDNQNDNMGVTFSGKINIDDNESAGADYTLAAYINDVKATSFPQKGEGYYVDEIVCTNNASAKWDYNEWGVKITNNQGNGTKCSVYFTDAYKDNSGANYPKLVDNMIPVYYDGSNWKYADIGSDAWYDYDAKEWANAVVLNDGVEKSVGETITEEEISLWYVWIPRYTYTIFNGNNGSIGEQEIQIKFEKGTSSTGTVECTDVNFISTPTNASSETCTDTTNGSILNGTSTYTHPAFTFGDTELTGFWVGKFEVSGSTGKITIKPNVSSLRNTTVSSFFTAIQDIKSVYDLSGDSHMMKNMEWGAVAYLTQSKYGTCTDGTCVEVSINSNSSYYTGGGTNDAYKTNVAQSTTKNIYGVYDMSGGSWEYVMGNMVSSSGAFYSSSAGFTSDNVPDSKYFDSYTYSTSYTNHARGKLGDATKETLKTFGSETGGWYSDYAYLPYSTYSWFLRGGYYGVGATAGVFNFNRASGVVHTYNSARGVVCAQ